MQTIRACLWFDDQAEAAAQFYTSVFKDSTIKSVTRYSEEAAKVAGRPPGSVLTVAFRLAGQEFLALNRKRRIGAPALRGPPPSSSRVSRILERLE